MLPPFSVLMRECYRFLRNRIFLARKQLALHESLVWMGDSQGLTACWFSAAWSLSGVYSRALDCFAIKNAFINKLEVTNWDSCIRICLLIYHGFKNKSGYYFVLLSAYQIQNNTTVSNMMHLMGLILSPALQKSLSATCTCRLLSTGTGLQAMPPGKKN